MKDVIGFAAGSLKLLPLWGLMLFSFASACIQQFFPPYPSDVLLLIFGGLAVTGVIAGPAALFPYIVGTLASSLVVFAVSRRLGRPILKNRLVTRFFPRRSQRRAGVYVRRYGSPALAVCKFLPGVNSVCLIVAGVMGLRGFAPILAIVLGGAAENAVYFLAGVFIGDNLESLYEFSSRFSWWALGALGGAAAIFAAVKFRRRLLRFISG